MPAGSVEEAHPLDASGIYDDVLSGAEYVSAHGVATRFLELRAIAATTVLCERDVLPYESVHAFMRGPPYMQQRPLIFDALS